MIHEIGVMMVITGIIMLYIYLTVYPWWVILRRVGTHPAWSVFAMTGIGAIALSWYTASKLKRMNVGGDKA